MFTTDYIELNIHGTYDLSKLESIAAFKRVLYRNERYFYKLAGRMHRYAFIPIDKTHLRLTIRATKQVDVDITADILCDLINKWLKLIEVKTQLP